MPKMCIQKIQPRSFYIYLFVRSIYLYYLENKIEMGGNAVACTLCNSNLLYYILYIKYHLYYL